MTGANFRAARAQRGFTLLELMVAIAILGLMLTAILAAQAGLYSQNVQARNITVGASAARCKMTEVEEQLLKDGYPEIDQFSEGYCCDGESPPGVTCKWAVERVLLPDPPGSDPGSDAGPGGASTSGGTSGLGGLGALAAAAASPSSLASGGIGGLSAALSAGTGPNGQAGMSGIAGMAMTIVYPQLRPLLEASIRRVTVNVVWNEGSNERKIVLVQFVTNPQKGLPPIDLAAGAGSALPGQPGGTGVSVGGSPLGIPTGGGGGLTPGGLPPPARTP